MRKSNKTQKLRCRALAFTEGIFSHSVDLALWLIVYTGSMSMPQSRSGQLWRAQRDADEFLKGINYSVIKQALKTASQRGLITRKRHAPPEITQAGKIRLASLLPTYHTIRPWDGRMHLVTYDIPEKYRKQRELLREQLKRLGCAPLQDSVWLTPLDPIDNLNSFTEASRLRGALIVSNLGKDGSIGEEDLQTLVVRIYLLDNLNKRYGDWLNEFISKKINHWSVIQYLAILKDDPQLPFALLPKDWLGDKAYQKIKAYL